MILRQLYRGFLLAISFIGVLVVIEKVMIKEDFISALLCGIVALLSLALYDLSCLCEEVGRLRSE